MASQRTCTGVLSFDAIARLSHITGLAMPFRKLILQATEDAGPRLQVLRNGIVHEHIDMRFETSLMDWLLIGLCVGFDNKQESQHQGN